MSIIALTNAAASIVWATGFGPLRVEYTLAPDFERDGHRAAIAFTDDTNVTDRVIAAYSNSGYDRGHLAPAADFKGRPEALKATYRATNLSPMRPDFNRVVWATVEREVRETAGRCAVPVTVTTIPVYGGTNRLATLAVPTGYVKLISTNGVTIAAWFKKQEN